MKNAAILTAAFLFLFSFFHAAEISAKEGNEWSNTSPALNLTHIFVGEINKKGRAAGFHHRPDGKDLPTARLKKQLSGPNRSGIYTALVEIFDPKSKQWKEKFSSLFPDRLKRKQLIKAIIHAFNNNTQQGHRKWQGPSGLGFSIAGYRIKGNRIVTAYPLYEADE